MHRRTLVALVVVIAAVSLVAPGCATNPLTGKRNFMVLSPEDEISLGLEAKPQFVDEFGGPYADPVVQQYVAEVGRKVAAEALKASHGYEYSFTVVDSDVVNAFALPGGPICITRGLLFELGDESELAGILAHEATHVAARHSAQQISREMGASFILSVVSAIASKGESGGSTSSETAQTLAKLVAGLASLKYSRDHETEADLYGVDFMVGAGYQPEGLVRVMQMFEAMEKEADGGGGPEFLRTHPNPENRAESIREVIRSKHPGAPTDGSLTVGREAYQKHVLSRRNLVKEYSKPKGD